MNNRTYAIVDTTTWEEGLSASGMPLSSLYTMILETSPETIRYSISGDQFVVKSNNVTYINILTSFAESYGIEYTLYDHAGVLEVMATSAWTIPMPEGIGQLSISSKTIKKKATKKKKKLK